MAVIIKNFSAAPLSLPTPFRGILKGGQEIKLNMSATQVIAYLGGPDVFDGAVGVEEVPDGAPYNDFYFAGDSVVLGGDVTGPTSTNTVVKIRNVPVSATAPTLDQILKFDGTNYVPSTTSVPTAAGDVTGSITANTVVKLQNRSLAATAPATNQAIRWNGSQWTPANDPNLGGDTTGAPGANTTTKIQNQPVATTTPVPNQALRWNGAAWESRPDIFRGPQTYVVGCAGVGDTQEDCDILDSGDGGGIKDAIAHLNDLGGGEVYIRRGTYAFAADTTNIVVGPNITITGAGKSTVLIPNTDKGNIFLLDDAGIVVRDIYFLREVMSSFGFVNEGGIINVSHHASDVLLENLTFRNYCDKPTSGISASIFVMSGGATRNVQINECKFLCTTNGSDFGDPRAPIVSYAEGGVLTQLSIDDCSFYSFDVDNRVNTAIHIRGGNTRITGCKLYNILDYGIIFDGRTSSVEGSAVTNNVIQHHRDNGKVSIYLIASDDNGGPITGVKVDGNWCGTDDGSNVDKCIVVQNGSSFEIKACVVNNNIVGNCSTGVQVSQGGAAITKTVIDSNNLMLAGTAIADTGTGTVVGDNAT